MQKSMELPDAGAETHPMLVMVGWIALIHFFVEALIMGMLSGWNLTRTVIEEGLLDCVLLTLLSSPPIYYLVAKPFIVSARTAEAALAKQIQQQAKQANELTMTLARLTRSLAQNEELRHKLQQSNDKIAELNERTLQRIGADLHDGPAQLLTYSLLRLGKFSPMIATAGGQKEADELEYMRVALTDTLTDVRNISRGLSLPQLSEATLEQTIGLAVVLHQEQTGTKVELSATGLPHDAPQAIKVCVYRVVQETLSNAYKHGQASEQKVICYMDKCLVLEISDRGPGFDRQNYNKDGLGLSGMRARVEALGGAMTIDTSDDRGTTVTVRLELEAARQWSTVDG